MKIKNSLRVCRICVWILSGILLFRGVVDVIPTETKAVKGSNDCLQNKNTRENKLYQAAYMEDAEGDADLEKIPMEISAEKPYVVFRPEGTGNYLLRITGTSEQEITEVLEYQFQQRMRDETVIKDDWTTQYIYNIRQWISEKGRTYTSLFPFGGYDECCEWRIYFDQETARRMEKAGVKLQYSLEKTSEWGNDDGILWQYQEGYPSLEYLKPAHQYARVYDYARRPEGVWEITVPEQLGGYPVEVIGQLAFYQLENINKISLPEGLLSLEGQAIARIPELQELELPSTLCMLGGGSFFGLGDRLRVRFPNGSDYFEMVEECILQKSNGIMVKYINDYVRYVILPDEVKEISTGAFYENYLMSLTVPVGVKSISNVMLAGCPELTKLILYNPDCELNVEELTSVCKQVVVYSYAGGEVQKTCEENGIVFQALDPAPATKVPATKVPAATQEPTNTGIPDATQEPDNTGIPDVTQEPDNTNNPNVSSKPDISQKPEITREPEKTIAPDVSVKSDTDNSKKQSISLELTQEDGKVTARWTKLSSASVCRLYRSANKNNGYQLVKKLSGDKNNYVDQNPARGKIYYYKVSVQLKQKGSKEKAIFSPAIRIKIKEADAPVFTVSKRKAGEIPYLLIQVKGRKKEYVQIYVAVDGGRYKKIALSNSSIRSLKGAFRIRYREGYRYFQIRLRTYKIVSGQRKYSGFSKPVKVNVSSKK